MEGTRHAELSKIVLDRINIARKHLYDSAFIGQARKTSSLESEIPGYENKTMKFGQFENRPFVVLMTDIRNSTTLINQPNGMEYMFQIYYAYAAMVANIIDRHSGTVTEFLGDGLLALFEIEQNNVGQSLMTSMGAAREIMEARTAILNPVLRQFHLPNIDYGIGIDYGPTIVTRFGFKGDNDLKAFGTCAHNVSRLSKGVNQIKVSQGAQQVWPVVPGGTLILTPTYVDNSLAYLANTTHI